METNTQPQVEGFILQLYRNGTDEPCYISAFDPAAVAGFNGYSPSKDEAVVFESREALLPLAAIEVESIEADDDTDEEFSMFDGFRILPFKGVTQAPIISNAELEAALEAFDN